MGSSQRYQTVVPKGNSTVAQINDTQAGRIKDGKPVGDWVARADKPHGKVTTPHINVNPTISGVPDPHTAISGKTLAALEGAGKALNTVSQVAKPLAIATDVVRLGNAVAADGGTVGDNTIRTSGSVAGGWAGAWAGATLGAEGGAYVGGAIGVWFGGAGAAPGAAIGGLVGGIGGGIVGSFGGSAAGEKVAEAATSN